MKKLLSAIMAAMMFAAASAQEVTPAESCGGEQSVPAEIVQAVKPAVKGPVDWSLVTGVDFDTFFDNREYVECAFGRSQTLFSTRLTPLVGIDWGGGGANRLMFGMDFRSDFGNATDIFAEIRPQIYYRYAGRNVAAYAGIFSRDRMIGDYGEMMVSDSLRFYDNRIQGVMGQYHGRRGYAELVVDWCGMYSEASREKFRVMSAGRLWFDRKHRFYGGYAFSMLHFAGSVVYSGSIVDNVMIDPYIGVNFHAWLDFDLRLHYIQSFQHDRQYEKSYRMPKGGMVQLRLSKWGIFIDEQLYAGENLQPFYSSYRSDIFPNGYGGELYGGETFFGTTKHIYNSLKIGYDRRFFNDTLRVNCFFGLQYDGTGWGNRQMVALSVRLLKDIPLNRKR
ncbi:MAG: hypothetical protein J1E04_06545 [Alistipes sp.]|nr:hypothetical protein [Alistipes sp.]